MPATSVLAFIVPKLAIQLENAASDCLYFILTSYPGAADSLMGYLSPAGVALPSPLEFTTQVMWEHAGGRPDMLGMKGELAFLVIEAKFGAPLTNNQPINYVEYLPKDGGGILLFLAPAARVEELWQTLNDRCVSARIPLGPRTECRTGLFAATLRGTNRLAITSWESLLSTLLHDLSPLSESRAHAEVLQLSALCERLLSGELAPSMGLVEPHADKRDRQLRAMVDAVVAKLVEAGLANTKNYRATPGPGYYKRYMTLSGRINWCVEFNTEYWARFGESLIWLSNNFKWTSADDRAALDAGLANSTRHIRKEILIPLLARHARSEAEALEQMTVQASAVAKLLASTPSAIGEGNIG